MQLNRIWPSDVYEAPRRAGSDVPAFAQVVEVVRGPATRSIHIAGTYGCEQDLTFAFTDMAGQVRRALENIRRSLAAVGATPADVVRIKTYTPDLQSFRAVGAPEFVAFWAGKPPVSTTIGIAALGLPGALVEMEAYAEVD